MNDYTLAIHTDPAEFDAANWDALLARQAQPTPFMRHAYLAALQQSGSATEASGWAPLWLGLKRGEQLVAATIAFLKGHSYGEYVFDWAWADAYQRHGLDYYPKLLTAVPFTPVPGSRLLAVDAPARSALLAALRQLAQAQQLSSAHLLFLDADEQAAARAAGWMLRSGVQFHWENRSGPDGLFEDFADFLASLQREKRKKIQQERRRVAEAGISFRTLEGGQITEADWDFFYRCYQQTYAEHRSTPYLTRDFFHRMASTMPTHWLLFIAEREGQPIAASLLAIDRASRSAWGRYWGAVAHVPQLHFEACYYQPLQWCIAQGFARFEGGAQGEHKMARGLLPVATASAHWLAHPQFSAAVEDFLARETEGMGAYMDELRERDPFKAPRPAVPE
ncbi:MAG TPA: GNAT family N-acetyltransferase [Ideonella sp.]|uniref:GNAT family N-acetyltransferase n=1 Tax=Ideonella sp. TaxID=1929293 RepID=UPI002BE91116|nr:GNAT family N-acetyltransferase [Ideonella sp.]HSI47548.1 GNAT family N-acetyltransferase [Ideonella sp.]